MIRPEKKQQNVLNRKKKQNQKLVERQQNGNKNSRNCRKERNINRNDDEGKIGYKLLLYVQAMVFHGVE